MEEKEREAKIAAMSAEVEQKGPGANCPSCGLLNPKDALTCRVCGARLFEGNRTKKEKAKKEKDQKRAEKQGAKKVKKEKKEKKPVKKEKAPRKLKYPFDTLTAKGQSFTVPHSEAKAGKVTVYENIQVLAREYGQRHDVKFEVSEEEGKKVLVKRI